MTTTQTVTLTLSSQGFPGETHYKVSNDFAFHHGIRIVSLPSSLQTYEDIKTFVEKSLGIGKVNTLEIVEMKKAKVPYKTAFIGFDGWYKNENTKKIVDAFSQCEKDVTIPVYINTPLFWENGSRMHHLSFRLVEPKKTVSAHHLTIKDAEWTSLYVPVVPENLSILAGDGSASGGETLEDLVENHLRLGKISRVDYIDRENDGFGSGVIKTAYIHFEYWNNTKNVIHFRNRMNTDGQIRISDFYDGKQMNKLFSFAPDKKTKMDRFVVFKINHLPITGAIDTTLNIHQIFAMKMKLEEEMVKRDNMIQSLININNDLIKCMANLEKEVVEERGKNMYLENCLFEESENNLLLETNLMAEEDRNKCLESHLMEEEERNQYLENCLDEEREKNLLLETHLITDDIGDAISIPMNDDDEEIHMMNIYNRWKYNSPIGLFKEDQDQDQDQEQDQDQDQSVNEKIYKSYKWEHSMDRGRAERLDDMDDIEKGEREQEQEQESE